MATKAIHRHHNVLERYDWLVPESKTHQNSSRPIHPERAHVQALAQLKAKLLMIQVPCHGMLATAVCVDVVLAFLLPRHGGSEIEVGGIWASEPTQDLVISSICEPQFSIP